MCIYHVSFIYHVLHISTEHLQCTRPCSRCGGYSSVWVKFKFARGTDENQ